MKKKNIVRTAILTAMIMAGADLLAPPQAVSQVYVPKNLKKFYCWGGGYCDCTLSGGNCIA